MRYKYIAINCHADLYTGEGVVKVKDFFSSLSPLMKADLLQDWKTEIDYLYIQALKEWRREADPKHEDAVDDQANIKRLTAELRNEA
jgi:hypothetical protein